MKSKSDPVTFKETFRRVQNDQVHSERRGEDVTDDLTLTFDLKTIKHRPHVLKKRSIINKMLGHENMKESTSGDHSQDQDSELETSEVIERRDLLL